MRTSKERRILGGVALAAFGIAGGCVVAAPASAPVAGPAPTDRPPSEAAPGGSAPPASPSPGPPRSCVTNADCGPGRQCQGPDGCNTTWSCGPPRACTRDLATFCGCDGVSFQSSSTCPMRPYAHAGGCSPPPSPPPPTSSRKCTSSADCTSNEQCAGPEGCGATWTCVPAKPCTKDLTTFCGCDGKPFFGSSSCPGKPYARKGPCSGGAGLPVPPPPPPGPPPR
jgi:hypothetical protein